MNICKIRYFRGLKCNNNNNNNNTDVHLQLSQKKVKEQRLVRFKLIQLLKENWAGAVYI